MGREAPAHSWSWQATHGNELGPQLVLQASEGPLTLRSDPQSS